MERRKSVQLVCVFLLAITTANAQITETKNVSFGNVLTVPASTTVSGFGNQLSTSLTFAGSQVSGPFALVSAPQTVAPFAAIPIIIKFTGGTAGNKYTGSVTVVYSSGGASLTLKMFTDADYVYIGNVYPKFRVLSVIYAPPGPSSFVDYGTSTMLGSSNSWEKTFSTGTQISTDLSIGKVFKVGISQTWTQEFDNSGSISVDKSTSFDISVPGPLNPNVGINHDYDIIEVWLNPQADFTVTTPNSALWKYNFDARDPANEMDVVQLYVTWLKHPSTIPPGIASRLARTWAGSGQGLTTADYSTILARDPLANGGTINSTRFDLQIGQTLSYTPPPAGGQPTTTTYSVGYQTTTVNGQSATDSYSVAFTKSSGFGFGNWFSANSTSTTSLAWQNKWGHEASTASGNKATVSITGPPAGYTGSTSVQVYKDNVYGTFMFAFVP